MSKTIKITGIILKITDTPGKDKLLHILTDSGVVTAFMTPKLSAGKKSYTYDVFVLCEFMIYVTDSDNCLINSVFPIEYYYGLRNDIVRLAAASYLSDLARYVAADAECDCKSLMGAFTHALQLLSDGEGVGTVKPVFEITAVKLLGFTPCLEAERKSNIYYFSVDDGRLFTNPIANGVLMPRTVVMSIYMILNSSVSDAYRMLPESQDEQKILYNAVQQYILYHIERDFPSLRFLNGVI